MDESLVKPGVPVTPDSLLLVEAEVGENDDSVFVVALGEQNGEFLAAFLEAADLADDGQAVLSLSDFFAVTSGDGIPNDVITTVVIQTLGDGSAFDAVFQRVTVVPEPSSAGVIAAGALVLLSRRRRNAAVG
ncbi:MAG: PEP-CTERM sorting domain-containing protein [Planctomycetota bacterium]